MVNSKHIWNPDMWIADIPVIHGLALDGCLECPHPFFSFGTPLTPLSSLSLLPFTTTVTFWKFLAKISRNASFLQVLHRPDEQTPLLHMFVSWLQSPECYYAELLPNLKRIFHKKNWMVFLVWKDPSILRKNKDRNKHPGGNSWPLWRI